MQIKHSQLWAAVSTISAIMLFVAILDMPYDYFQLLRVVVFATSIYGVWYFYNNKRLEWVWTIVIVGLIFNPLVPLSLGRGTWIGIDIATALVLLGSFLPKRILTVWSSLPPSKDIYLWSFLTLIALLALILIMRYLLII